MKTREEKRQALATTFVEKVRHEVLLEVLDELQSVRDQMTNIMDNGRPILEQAYGRSFARIYEKRQVIWAKLATLDKTIGKVLELM